MIAPAHGSHANANFRRLIGLEATFLRSSRAAMGMALAALVLQALLALPIPWLQGIVIDRLGQGGDLGRLLALAAAIPLTCLLGRMLLGWLSGSLMSRVSLEFVRALTDSLHHKLQRLPLAWFDRQETGQLMARLTSDVGTLLIFLGSGSLQLVADLVLATGIFFVLLLLSWPLALASLAALPLFWLSYRWHSPRISSLAKSTQEQNAAVYALLSERLSAIRTVRASGSHERELAAFDSQLDEQMARGRRNLNANAAQNLAALLIGGLGAGIIVCLAALFIQRRWLTLGEAVAFLAYLALLYQPLIRLAQFYGGIAATLAAVE